MEFLNMNSSDFFKFIKKYRLPILGIFFIVLIIGTGVFLRNSPYRSFILQQPIAQHFVHTYFSIRKVSDILFFPYIFAKNELPTYSLRISSDNINRLNERLSIDPISGKLKDENKIFVKAYFTSTESGLEYDDYVKVRYRGLSANHWNSLKKSLRIQFPDENYFNGVRLMNFVTPYDRGYFIEPLNMYRAKKLGLIDLEMYFSRLHINGFDSGVYLTFEHWSPEFLAKKSLPESPLFGVRDELEMSHTDPLYYKNYLDEDGTRDNEELRAFLRLLYEADDKTFKSLIPEILNMESFYKWSVLNIVSGTNHQDESHNTILYFNGVTGKFEIIPWDLNVGDPKIRPYNDAHSVLMNRVFSINAFKTRRNEILDEYLKDDTNLLDDLSFYDGLYADTKKEFFNDSYKLHNNLKFLKTVRDDRKLIIENWENAKKVLGHSITYSYTPETVNTAFNGSFTKFLSLGWSRDSFVANNPMFYPIGINSVGLTGSIFLTDDVIIPSSVQLIIEKGTRVFLDSEVSLIVNGSVNVLGTFDSPVTFKRLNQRKPWGTFLIKNAGPEMSNISFLYAEGGSGSYINGVTTTGMVSVHNSDVMISNSMFREASDDDALNIKKSSGSIKRSYFSDNISDALDIDFSYDGFQVYKNTFNNNGGDAIDMSYSKIDASENVIETCGDKGISVGEKSQPVIFNNHISKCTIGIAVKDLSYATIKENSIIDNGSGVSLYKKKEEFGGARADLISNSFDRNKEDVVYDDFSSVLIK